MTDQRISIHAPAQGATRDAARVFHVTIDFNPRSRAGSDIQRLMGTKNRRISIHAPAQGATGLAGWLSGRDKFQSTLPRRERLSAFAMLTFPKEFQSTLPRRERLRCS